MNWRDVISRAAWTFAQAFLAVLVISPDWSEVATSAKAGAVAGLAALLSLAKTTVAQRMGQ